MRGGERKKEDERVVRHENSSNDARDGQICGLLMGEHMSEGSSFPYLAHASRSGRPFERN